MPVPRKHFAPRPRCVDLFVCLAARRVPDEPKGNKGEYEVRWTIYASMPTGR
jgi:hypothetical protein